MLYITDRAVTRPSHIKRVSCRLLTAFTRLPFSAKASLTEWSNRAIESYDVSHDGTEVMVPLKCLITKGHAGILNIIGVSVRRGSCWRHDSETLSTLPVLCEGIHGSPVNSPHTGPVMRSLQISFVINLNKWTNKQSRCQWFVTAWWWRDVIVIMISVNIRVGIKWIFCWVR